jgi:hypothetical protein
MYRLVKSALILVCFFLLSNSFAQKDEKYILNGFVFDESNGESLIGANLLLKELKTGNYTNSSGFFAIPGIPKGKYSLVASYIGFKTKTLQLEIGEKKINPVKIYLVPDQLQTNEIVISADTVDQAIKMFEKPVSKIEMNARQINQIPRIVEADLLRVLQTMPGITSLSDFSSELYVRGGTPDQNLYLIDGTDVYNPDHAFGIFSTFNTNAIKKVDISKGGFGAEYGGRLSSVLNVTNLDGNRNKFEGVVNISMLSASTTLQMPVGSFGSISGSIRRTYLEMYADQIKEIPDYYFYDGNLKGYFDLGDNDKLTLSYFNGQDNLDFKLDKDAPESFRFLYNWGNTTGSVNWKHIFNSKFFSSLWFTGSRFKSDFSFDQIMNMKEENLLTDYSIKEALEYYFSNELNFKLGVEHKTLHFLYDFEWANGIYKVDNKPLSTEAYISASWKPNQLWDIEPGVHYSRYRSEKTFSNLDPRFAIKYRLSETSSLKFATGIYHQYMNKIPRLFFSGIWASADDNTRASSSTHFVLGYQKNFENVLQLEAELYYKDYKNIYKFNENFNASTTPTYYNEDGNPVFNSTANLFTRGDGKSYGLELLLRKDIGAITGWVSYSLSKTKYSFDSVNRDNEFDPRHDRTSVINLVLNSDINSIFSGKWNEPAEYSDSKWLVGINFVYATGQPITTPGSAYYVNTLPDWNNYGGASSSLPNYKLYPGQINDFRLPDYVRMDFSLTYQKNYGSWSIDYYLQIFNIGNRKNIWFIDYKDKYQNGAITQEIEKVTMIPLLPSLGISIKF